MKEKKTGKAGKAGKAGKEQELSAHCDVLTQLVLIQQYSRGGTGNGALLRMAEAVLVEYQLSLYVNGKMLIQIVCLPSHLKELVVGYLFAEGMIGSCADILSLEMDEEAGRADVSVARAGEEAMKAGKTGLEPGAGWVTTEAGDAVGLGEGFVQKPLCPLSLVEGKGENMNRDSSTIWEGILNNANRLLSHSKLFRLTGNVHSVMLCRGEDMLCCMEDVGRFSAFDKCLGRAVMERWRLEDTCIYTTGRVPSKLVHKTIRAGIPMLVSRSAPTDAALAAAAAYGVTIVGFARRDRLNVYGGRLNMENKHD